METLNRRLVLRGAVSLTAFAAGVALTGFPKGPSHFMQLANAYRTTYRTGQPGETDDDYHVRLEAEHDHLMSLPVRSSEEALTLVEFVRDSALTDAGDKIAFGKLIGFLSGA